MVEISLLPSAVLMGAALLALGVAASTYGSRRDRDERGDTQSAAGPLARVANSQLAWIVGFLGLIGAAGGGALLYVIDPSMLWLPVGVMTSSLLLYLVWGVYYASRHRGLHRPAALAAALWMAGTLVLAAVVLRLTDVLVLGPTT